MDRPGLAWFEFSKTGQTIYFDNKALKKLKIPGLKSMPVNIGTKTQKKLKSEFIGIYQ